MRTTVFGVMAIAMLAGLAGCGDDVPNVQDPDRIVIRGKMLSQQEFLNTYCKENKSNATCAKVSESMLASSKRAGGVARN